MIYFKKLWKLFIITIAIFTFLFIGIDHLLRSYLIIPQFSALERQEASKVVDGIADTIRREAYHLGQIAADWAVWDDMYEYVHKRNKAFERSNFQWKSLNDSGIDLIYVCASGGKMVWGGIHDPELKKNIPLKEFSDRFCSLNFQLLQPDDEDIKYQGVILTERGPMLISFQTILTSTGEGPGRGTLVMGRFIRKNLILELAKQTRIPFTIKDMETSSFSVKEKKAINQLVHGKRVVFEEINDRVLRGFVLINDIWKKPALLIQVNFPRDIMQRGINTKKMVSFTILAAFAIIYIFIVVWFLFFRIESLRRQEKIEDLVTQRTWELHESEERLRTLINSTPDIICFKDGHGRWLEANQAVLQLFHLTDIDYRGKKDSELAEVTHPIFRKAFLACRDSDNLAWESRSLSRCKESILTPDGQVKVYDVIKVPIFHSDGSRKGLIVFGRDITHEKALQDKLHKAEKMEAIGLMAGGVAHDLNNILSGLVSYPDILLLQLPEDSNLRQYIEAIKDSGMRASEVVYDLLTVARGIVATKEVANMNTLIEEYIESPECKKIKSLYPNIICETQLDPDLFNLFCSPIHIKKCIMNLLNNAAEAISGNGLICISTSNKYIDKPLPGNQYMKRGEYVQVIISDTGSGIPEKDIDRIFEPFYTKKVMGRSGTGLGLTVVWNTVQDHNGGIKVTSSDKGTSFELYFPSTREELSENLEKIDIDELQGHGEHILVVDDEVQQQDITQKMLVSLGYHVKCVDSGEDAIQYLREKTVDLVVLDMIMDPGINGRQTYEEIIKLHRHQKAIIVSGFSKNEDVKITQEMGAGKFVKKPYVTRQIALAVKQTLQD